MQDTSATLEPRQEDHTLPLNTPGSLPHQETLKEPELNAELCKERVKYYTNYQTIYFGILSGIQALSMLSTTIDLVGSSNSDEKTSMIINLCISALFLGVYLIPFSKCVRVFRKDLDSTNVELFKSASSTAHCYVKFFIGIISFVIISCLLSLFVACFLISSEDDATKDAMVGISIYGVVFYGLMILPFIWLRRLYNKFVLFGIGLVEENFEGYSFDGGYEEQDSM